MIFILLVYDFKNTSSQTCLLKYLFRALENISRGMSGPTVRLEPRTRQSKNAQTMHHDSAMAFSGSPPTIDPWQILLIRHEYIDT